MKLIGKLEQLTQQNTESIHAKTRILEESGNNTNKTMQT
jgi:hypothetical protein